MAWTRTILGVAGTSVSTAFPDTFVGNLEIKGPRPWVDVRAHGAKGDGTTDDTTAFVNALAAAAGGVLAIPGFGMTYIVNPAVTALTIASNTTILGFGRPVIKLINSSGALDYVLKTASGASFVRIYNIKIDGNKANQTNVIGGFAFVATTDSSATDLEVDSASGIGIAATGAATPNGERLTLVRPRATNNGFFSTAVNIHGIQSQIRYTTIIDAYAANNASLGIRILSWNSPTVSPMHVRILGGTVENNGQGSAGGNDGSGGEFGSSSNNEAIGLVARGNGVASISAERQGWIISGDHNRIIGGVYEDNKGAGIIIHNSRYNRVIGATIRNNGQTVGSDTRAGIRVFGTAPAPIQNWFIGNTIVDDQGTPTQQIGIHFQNAGVANNTVALNTFSGNVIAPVAADTSADPYDVILHANTGQISEKNVLSGTFAIDSTGLKTVTIAHGISTTAMNNPKKEMCQLAVVEETNVDDWAYNLLKVDSVDATNVTAKINVSTASATGAATARLALRVQWS